MYKRQILDYTDNGEGSPRVGTANPFRYRGYYYDNESGFYYLQSRYYDPVTGRFLNADGTLNSGTHFTGFNLFAYCWNNPVNMVDDNGELPKWIVDAANAAFKQLAGMKKWEFWKYYPIKAAISLVGTAFLDFMRYPLASAMFNHAIWGGGRSISSNIYNLLVNKLKYSYEMSVRYTEFLRRNSKNWSTSVTFKSGDLYYAIQKANIYISREKRDWYWILTVTVYDKYDFSEFRKGLGFSNLANNLGWAMQSNGMMTPYNWSVTYKINYR